MSKMRKTRAHDSHMMLHDLWENWLALKSLNLAPTTLANYRGHIQTHLDPALGHLLLRTITNEQLLTYFAGKLKTMSRVVVSSQMMVLRQVFEFAIQRDYLPISPMRGLKISPGRHTTATVLDVQQLRDFLREARRSRYYPLYVVAAFTGLRRGELLGLRWSNVDWTSGVLRVEETLVRIPLTRNGEKRWITKEPKTAESRRHVEVPPAVLSLLRGMYERRAPQQEHLFSQPNGRSWPIDHLVNYDLPRICKRAGVPAIRLHDLRHTHATLLLSHRFNPRSVQRRLGHSTVAFLLSTYAHVLPGDGREMADELQRLLAQTDGLP